MNNNVHPEILLKDVLLQVQQPARYIGGEYQLKPITAGNHDYRIGLCFPDLYEIGMANNALRILYDLINNIEGIVCERVFAPAPDFERVLRERRISLYTLESGIPLSELDMICFTVGYELSAASILNVLDLGGIPLRNEQRCDNHPVVLAGGPAVTNPLPFSSFFDGVYIGEAEAALPGILKDARNLKHESTKRSTILSRIRDYDCIWYSGKNSIARAVDMHFTDFSGDDTASSGHGLFSYYTVPTLKPVQDHGVVEIMRGCPNGCRFCHAGEFYKPYRQRSSAQIEASVRQLVEQCGYRDVTLSSLSSGDHPDILAISKNLAEIYSDRHVSFSLPSLKVDTFSLSVLNQIAAVRKSGLTFAVETPNAQAQKSMNKEVPAEQVAAIIRQAKQLGWKTAKFYFMTGLPFVNPEHEIEEITKYISEIQRSVRIQLNINIGTFIPKPHTPFQWAPLMDPDRARTHLLAIKRALTAQVKNVKVSFQDPYISFIEGVLSRGDERVGDIIELAFLRGARLDAWDEYFRKDVWESVFADCDWDVKEEICRTRTLKEPLPWDGIQMASSKAYLRREYLRAESGERSAVCEPDCSHNCGVCKPLNSIERQSGKSPVEPVEAIPYDASTLDFRMPRKRSKTVKYLFQYSKEGKAIYFSHIQCMHMFEKAFQRAGIAVAFTRGFNPKPILEFVQPLPLGITGLKELFAAVFELPESDDRDMLIKLNKSLPEGFCISKAEEVSAVGKSSLTTAYFASDYSISDLDDDGRKLLAELAEDNTNIEIFQESDDRVTLRIREAQQEDRSHGADGSEEKPTGNLMKLVGSRYDKYKFLSRYTVTRKGVYTKNMKEYYQVFSI
jgi:radical SAM family uncharacterized protein/radical SAM-linked protein